MTEAPIITRVLPGVHEIAASQWNALLAQQLTPTPFMQHAYLAALQHSGSATPASGWQPVCISLWQNEQLVAACPLYLKSHSWGEYVFDMAWARAYHAHGLAYYPKATLAVPFTPVPGSRLLAANDALRVLLVRAVQAWCSAQGLSSAHMLFGDPADHAACAQAGWLPRTGVQFHWHNRSAHSTPQAAQSETPEGFRDFDDFLGTLQQAKRKKIRQERQRVAQADVQFECLEGSRITPTDWDFFYACYVRTYEEHHNAPYLTREFFDLLAQTQAGHWVLFIASRAGRRIACSLIAVSASVEPNSISKHLENVANNSQAAILFDDCTTTSLTSTPQLPANTVAYGRYWGALERVDCLHFEACYYQPIAWCIARGVSRFEGGAQGEHKMARALLPVQTTSYHWLAEPAFAQAVDDFLQQECAHMSHYLQVLQAHSPIKQTSANMT